MRRLGCIRDIVKSYHYPRQPLYTADLSSSCGPFSLRLKKLLTWRTMSGVPFLLLPLKKLVIWRSTVRVSRRRLWTPLLNSYFVCTKVLFRYLVLILSLSPMIVFLLWASKGLSRRWLLETQGVFTVLSEVIVSTPSPQVTGRVSWVESPRPEEYERHNQFVSRSDFWRCSTQMFLLYLLVSFSEDVNDDTGKRKFYVIAKSQDVNEYQVIIIPEKLYL